MQFVLFALVCLKRELELGMFVLYLCAYLILLEGVIDKRSNEINSRNCHRKNSQIICSDAKKEFEADEMMGLIHTGSIAGPGT